MAKMICRRNPQHIYDSDDYTTCPECPAFSEAQGMKRPPADAQPPRAPRPESIRTQVRWGFQDAKDPVVGWLVAISGPAKGKDYAVRSGNNSIGRGSDQKIYIPEDPQVASAHAIITYDPLVLANKELLQDSSMFYIAPHPGIVGLVRVRHPKSEKPKRWELVTAPRPLHRWVEDDEESAEFDDEDGEPKSTGHYAVDEYPVIWIGQTELMFVAFCGNQFAWVMEGS